MGRPGASGSMSRRLLGLYPDCAYAASVSDLGRASKPSRLEHRLSAARQTRLRLMAATGSNHNWHASDRRALIRPNRRAERSLPRDTNFRLSFARRGRLIHEFIRPTPSLVQPVAEGSAPRGF